MDERYKGVKTIGKMVFSNEFIERELMYLYTYSLKRERYSGITEETAARTLDFKFINPHITATTKIEHEMIIRDLLRYWHLNFDLDITKYFQDSLETIYLKGNPNYANSLGVQYIFSFDNDYKASVIKHPGSYGYLHNLWEMALMDGDGNLIYINDFKDDVIGYLSDKEVEALLNKISRY